MVQTRHADCRGGTGAEGWQRATPKYEHPNWLAGRVDHRAGVWSSPAVGKPASTPPEPLRCAAFSPYVDGYNPNSGPHPPPALIDALLEAQVKRLGFRCIMTYGMLNGLDIPSRPPKAGV